uniref:Uncharacterized protein n=1 Tax=Avena sativa TaxID=4498 RepID=A0ACD5X2Z4_AVESA
MVTVIVTTRDEAIAREICHSVEPYKLEILTNEMCWTIIKEKTGFKDRVNKKQLKHIGREIATKCGGVALAAQSLGYMLNNMKHSDEWESVRDSYIWNLSTSKGSSSGNHEVLASLLLSYSHMPDWLKLCFSYCAVFPKGHLIVKYDLIHQWIALGFTEQSSPFDSMQLCEKYVTQLLGMSFLQYSKTQPSSDEQQDKDVTLFMMHDLVHDLATAILADKVNKKGNVVGSSCYYALLTDCSKQLQLSSGSLDNTRFKFLLNLFQNRNSCENIKALFFMDCGKIELRDVAFSPAKCLLVLDLSQCFIQKLPDSIGQLKQLRFLRAPRIQDQMIPDCITELSELNYLNFRGSCNISTLPESIGDLKGLMHFDLSGCGQIHKLPKSFAELKQLVHLDLSDCRMPILEDFCGFTKLQYLNLSVGDNSFLAWRGPLEVISNLNKLRYLNLSRCIRAMSEDQIPSLLDSISTLSNLEHLDLSENEYLKGIPESMGNLRKLHTLDLLGCSQLKKLPDSMVSLKVLIVEDWVTLDGYVLSMLNIASLPHFVVHASSHKCSSNIIRLQHTNPVELTIDRLENVKSAEEAQSIKLIEKQKIKELKFQWTVAAGRFVDDKEVLEKLVPPSSVKKLSITGYMSASFPDWLMCMRQYLTNLLEINLCDFPKCNYLLPLGHLPKLELLSLRRMEGLEELNTTYTSGEEGVSELMFPKLKTLRITQCSKLKLNGNTQQLSRLESLSLSHCGSITLIPQWLGELTSLKKFEICDCEAIMSLPDSIKKLSNLEFVHIDGCPKLVEWYESKENKMKLAHIRDVKLYRGPAKALEEYIAETFVGTTNKGKKLEATIDELHTDLLYSAVMNMPGFTEEALLVALSHLMDNKAQGSAYMGMHEEARLLWLMNFLKKHY